MAESTEQTVTLTLHKLSSSAAHRVNWALEELSAANGLKFNVKHYSRHGKTTREDLKKIFPLGKSPILEVESTVDGAPQKKVMTESRIILQYLADAFSNGIWTPQSPQDQERDAFMQEFANSTLLVKNDFALIFEVIPAVLTPPLSWLVGLMVKPVVAYFMTDLNPIYQYIEDSLSDEKPWFSGAKLGLADFNASFGMDISEQRGYFDGKKYPKLAAWLKRVHERPAYRMALEGSPYDLKKFR
ncbi:putative glutathione S-transferase [Aulographum hederae CBS 113979]|uniref:Putative glutathione S-transferase n=1 Tax=Aulographum hederae CBS 113979 TaxID=1176131 RepID=A0A6G1HDG7_9PEZI|nr:putative glutathione S-transferase [Aulographum hederae CBS 113979]